MFFGFLMGVEALSQPLVIHTRHLLVKNQLLSKQHILSPTAKMEYLSLKL